MSRLYREEVNRCGAWLRHKSCLLSPEILTKHKIPYNVTHQNQGEFIVTFPKGYHGGKLNEINFDF